MTLPKLLPPFSGSMPTPTLLQQFLNSDFVPKEGFFFVVLLSVLLSLHHLNVFAWLQACLHHSSLIHNSYSVVQDISGRGVWVLLQMIVNNYFYWVNLRTSPALPFSRNGWKCGTLKLNRCGVKYTTSNPAFVCKPLNYNVTFYYLCY